MKYCLLTVLLFVSMASSAQSSKSKLKTGADQTELYVPYLKGKKVGMVMNATSTIGNKLSVDSLKSLGIDVQKIFAPEHGFRGDYSNGAKVADGIDPKTGIPLISLYGKHLKPSPEDLAGLDILIFDIQDVGARFYTYISTLHYVMEACEENQLELLLLDRPNPNGFYVDGPVLDEKFKSFIGMHPVPIVHGMTMGEYAQMINGEGWLNKQVQCKLKIIKVANYTHQTAYEVPIKPSPNLNTQASIYLYPSLCLFEGTVISQGRGTYHPFQVLGSPELKGKYRFSFKPQSIAGMSENPIHLGKDCYGIDLRNYPVGAIRKSGQLNLKWLIQLYKAYPDKASFFDYKKHTQMGNFDKLAGIDLLKAQIIAGKSEEEIRLSWEPALSQFKLMRKKYLLYP
jgi:uncharacterized protein YbbC (DUF1343 family)